ncbi:MAG: histidine--tRNA ligase [Roseiarcus sp.]|uniref:histidine--tRNA ligase n=1 Tax=Roseiarcus sp. TaxID=1969460 RepID=UPI003C3CE972
MIETDAALARAALPRGFIDRDSADLAAAEAMMAKIRKVYELYGFEAVETPFVEYTEALGKFLPDQDRPNAGVFSFKDDDEQWLSLRYDLTAPLARYVAEHYEKLPKPYRSYRAGWVFRNEKPGPGRFRQFMQFDADTVGAASPAADAEICMMAADCLEALGIARGDYVIKVNNRKVLDGVMEAIGLGGEANAGRRLVVLRAIDKLDRLGPDGVRALLGDGRKDESGDFTKGAGLEKAKADALLDFLQPKFPQDILVTREGGRIHEQSDEAGRIPNADANHVVGSNASTIDSLRHLFDQPKYQEGLDELSNLAEFTESAGFSQSVICIDPSVVRGLEYYTGPVFEAELTFETPGEDGRPIRFGSVGGGGRYDGLVARFRAEPVPATGFSIGVSRLLAALRAIKSPIVAGTEAPGPVVVLALDRDEASMANYQRLVASLRRAGIAAELYLGSGGMNAQLKYADRRQSRVAVIQGSNERNAPGGPQVTIRDLKLGAELAKATKDRADYLELRKRAQFSAPEAELVERVREMLTRE